MTRRKISVPARLNNNIKNKNANINKTKKKKNKAIVQQEVSAVGKILRTLGGLGGTALGGMIGQPSAGGAIGTGLGAAVSRWLGAGDYSVTSNTLVARASSGIPMMHREGQSVIVRHREFVRSIPPTVGFTVYDFALNPGVAQTFPWLSNIARQYEEYEFKGIIFHYIPTSGVTISGTNSSMGSVMMYTTYRATDRAPGNKLELLNEYWSNETRPDITMAHPIECDPRENPFQVHYVRSNLPVGEKLMYDIGTTYIATEGQQGTAGFLGDLWVTYEVELKKPIIASNVTDSSGYYISLVGVDSPATMLNNLPATPDHGNLPITFSGNTLTFSQGLHGTYLIDIELRTTSTFTACTNAWETVPTVVNCGVVSAPVVFYPAASVVVAASACNVLRYRCAIFYINHLVASVTIPTPNYTTTGSVNVRFQANLITNADGALMATPLEAKNAAGETFM